ncbi:M50 family metallopeptidase [Mycolicibacterium sp. XJ2546]
MGHKMTEAELDRIAAAFHEAGHCVSSVILGGRVHQAVIHKDGGGQTEFDVMPAGTDAAVTLAGPWCEARWTIGRRPGPADLRRILAANQSDDHALCAAGGAHTGAEVVPLLERCWPAVKAVTTKLYFKGRASHQDVCKALGLVDDGGPSSLGLAMIRSGGVPGTFNLSGTAV